MKIAIVGTGISGLVCAHRLHRRHDVTVFEANDYVGGHSHTVEVSVEGTTHAVDTGFIVYNEANYPEFTRLLAELGVATQPTTMSFSVRDETTGLEYRADGLGGLFAQRANLVDPRSGGCWPTSCASTGGPGPCWPATPPRSRPAIRPPRRGSRTSRSTIWWPRREPPRCSWPTTWCRWARPSGRPTPTASVASRPWPASRFMDNHGLLHVRGTPHWRTVTGGSRRYVDALAAPFAHRIRLATPVTKIRRHRRPDGRVEVELLSRRRRSRAVRPGDPGQPQRPGPGPVERPERRRARHPGCVALPAKRGHPAHRRAVPAPAAPPPGRAGTPTSGAPARARDGGPATR